MIRLYCGTYSKYNSGSLHGKWFDLADYSDMESLYDDFAELHKDDPDPEYMFQDYEVDHSFLSQLVGESWLHEDVFEIMEAFENADLDLEVYSAYEDASNMFDPDNYQEFIDDCEEAYYGKFESDADFAQHLADESGDMADNVALYSKWPYYCIDWDHAARDIMMDFMASDGYYFRVY